jgi:hypothetical protein
MAKPLSRRSAGRSTVAKRDGACAFCPEPIRAHIDFIAEAQPIGKWGHTHCVQGYCNVINEHLEDEAA